MLDVFDSYRRIVDKLEENACEFTVSDFQSSESFTLSLYRSILDYAKMMDSSFRNKDYIALPVALRAMAEAFGSLYSLCSVENFGNSYELSGLDQRRKDINSFIKYADENPRLKEKLKVLYDKEKEELSEITPIISKLKAKEVKIVRGINLFKGEESLEIYHTAYRLSNSFLHNDIFAIERRNWKRVDGINIIVSASNDRSDLLLSCLYYSVKIVSSCYWKVHSALKWPDESLNLDSKIKSFLVRYDKYANLP